MERKYLSKKAKKNYDAYQQNYRKEKTRTFTIKLSKEKDADIIEYLDSETNKADLLRRLIRNEIQQEKHK